MKHTITKYNCDNCDAEMTESEYDAAVKVTIRLDVPDPRGGAGDCNAMYMKICNKCAAELGIDSSKIHNGRIDARGRILAAIENGKTKILNLFFSNAKR